LIVEYRERLGLFLTSTEVGVEDERLRFASDSAEVGELLARTVRSGDVVLIKGSRGVKLSWC
jgi:UDP-N-acetylmuramyl pentapeptide synthase